MKTSRSIHPVLWPVLLGAGLTHGLETGSEAAPEPVTPVIQEVAVKADESSLSELEESIECVKRLSETFKELSQGVGPAVASVTAHVSTQRGLRQLAQGSGVVLSKDGLLVTNNHVVSGGKVFRASFQDGRDLEAFIVGTDAESDLAFLQLEGSDFAFARLAERDAEVGEFVLALGNPYGMGHTVTSGIVSGLGKRDIGLGLTFEDFIQTNAHIHPGNSGGPLVDLFGRVLGLNTAILEGSRRGISYAIPADMIRRVKKDIIEVGYVRRGYLGVRTDVVRASSGSPRSRGRGVIVVEVLDDTPAKRAELEVGDVLLSIQGERLSSRDDLLHEIERILPGTVVELVVERNGERVERQVTLEQRPRD